MIALSCIVVVCTVYALSLPAQTLTCDKEEHTHTAECYDENNELICEKEEHTHTDDCNKQEPYKNITFNRQYGNPDLQVIRSNVGGCKYNMPVKYK